MRPHFWNADRQRVDGGYQTRIGVKWRNFLSGDQWKAIDLSPVQAGGLFTISKAPFSAEIAPLANDWSIFQSTNRYDIWANRVMPDAPVGIQKRYPTAANVAGEIIASGILFNGAFPALNASRLVQFHEQEIRDLVVFASEPPGNGPVEVPLEIDFGTLPILESEGRGKPAKEQDFRNDRNIDHGLSFTTSQFRGLKIKAPQVWDSAGRRAAVQVRGRVIGSHFIGKKVIPRQFFNQATYPVYADTVTTFYPDPHAESTSVDGHVFYESGSPELWDDIRDAATGTTAADTGAEINADVQASVTTDRWQRITRAFVLFDTSSITDTDTVTDAILSLYGTTITSQFGGSVKIVDSNPASNTAIVTADYDATGTTEYSTALISALSTGAYNAFVLNSAGRAAVSLVGVTKFGIRISSDFSDSEPTWASGDVDAAYFSSADEASTSQDPKLDVTHTAAGIADNSGLGMALLGVG